LSGILESKISSDDLNLINSKFKHYSLEIDKLIARQTRIITALRNREPLGISIRDLYTLSKPNYVAKEPELNLSKVAQDLKYHALPQLLDTIRFLEHSCKKFDSPQSPWIYRKDFSTLSFTDKNILTERIDRIASILKEKDAALLTANILEQQKLLESLIDLGSILKRAPCKLVTKYTYVEGK
jgi:hypothetical protein